MGNLFNQKRRAYNKFVIVGLGEATKTITFKENEFKRELVPKNASIVHNVINHERIVTMTYRV